MRKRAQWCLQILSKDYYHRYYTHTHTYIHCNIIHGFNSNYVIMTVMCWNECMSYKASDTMLFICLHFIKFNSGCRRTGRNCLPCVFWGTLVETFFFAQFPKESFVLLFLFGFIEIIDAKIYFNISLWVRCIKVKSPLVSLRVYDHSNFFCAVWQCLVRGFMKECLSILVGFLKEAYNRACQSYYNCLKLSFKKLSAIFLQNSDWQRFH